MRSYGRSGFVQPGVAVRVIDMPVCINERCDLVRSRAVKGGRDARFGNREPGIDEKLAIFAGENGDITARAFQNADIATQWVHLDLRLRRCLIIVGRCPAPQQTGGAEPE
jgi:hypothetical protein